MTRFSIVYLINISERSHGGEMVFKVKKIGTVFISHSSQEPDYSATQALSEALEGIGIDVWWDKEGLEGGDFFAVEILEAIIRRRFFIFIVSERSIQSKWCLRELIRATELDKEIKPLVKQFLLPTRTWKGSPLR